MITFIPLLSTRDEQSPLWPHDRNRFLYTDLIEADPCISLSQLIVVPYSDSLISEISVASLSIETDPLLVDMSDTDPENKKELEGGINNIHYSKNTI